MVGLVLGLVALMDNAVVGWISAYGREGEHGCPAVWAPPRLDWDGRFEPTFKELNYCAVDCQRFIDDFLCYGVPEPF